MVLKDTSDSQSDLSESSAESSPGVKVFDHDAAAKIMSQNHKAHGLFTDKMLSLSTSSLTSILPNFYNIGNNYSMPSLLGSGDERGSEGIGSFVSDELARESDVTVSTNVTSQAEYKGFASFVISGIFLLIWLGWSLIPTKILNDLGIYYFPSRWWALAIPAWILMAMVYTYIALALYNIEVATVPLNDLRTLVDDAGVVVTEVDEDAAHAWEKEPATCFDNEEEEEDNDGCCWGKRPKEKTQHHGLEFYIHNPTSGIWDLPISTVNKVLYSNPES